MTTANGVEIRNSPLSFEETMVRLQAAIAERGLRLFDVIDHRAAATDVGLELRPTRVLIFGSPVGGTPLMVEWPPLALELPLRIVVWEGDDGTTRAGYLTADALVQQFELDAERVAPLRVPAAIVADSLADM
jgi:uncharacterized protein (DUF302 family)